MMFSLSKSVVSMAVGFAVQEGLLTLDDKAAGYFPDKNVLFRSRASTTSRCAICSI
ncbi:MAG: serine hydrolase [Anaeromassilibacillus sp.]